VFFFLISLILCLALSATLMIGLFRSLRINWDRKNRRPIGFLTPVLLTALFLFFTISMTVPRLLDALSALADDCVIEEIQADAGDIGWCSLREDGRRLTFNPWQYKLEAARTYRVAFTPRSGYIIELNEVAGPSAPNP
jgi:hypothetical protein